MKLMFASDIHGLGDSCKKMLDRYSAENADKLILLGDLLYHGPRNGVFEGYAPDRVIAMLNEAKREIICVKGNCDGEVDQMVLDFPIMAEYMTMWLDGKMALCTHGHVHTPQSLPCLNKGDIYISGHTHIYRAEYSQGIYLINTGSVSLPKNGNPKTYVIYENGVFRIVRLDGEPISEISCG
ncbi:MAG: phosphodiesterase [Oscillospiraceae bacterium]|nr:phosphodiesterase [Oscillospiraceae bacterium]